jgi:catechol 2,3-dioxygenase-like lactoylglutathione lyase family enzyme
MEEMNVSKATIKGLNQVGIIVRDIEKTVKDYWNILGIGPHIIVTVEPTGSYDMTYMGKPAKFKFRASFAQAGQTELELIQSLEGPTIYADYLRTHGEGANHIRSIPDSMEAMDKNAEIMSRNGFPVIMDGHDGTEVGFAYIDTVKALKTIWEAVKMPGGPPNVPVTIYPANEKEVSPAKIKVKAISRVGIAVKDLDYVAAHYEKLLGIGKWDISEPVSSTNHSIMYRGKSVKTDWKAARAGAGQMQLELIQPGPGDNIFTDFIDKQGEGIHHLQFLVDDIKETKDIMKKQGFTVLMEGESSDGSFAFFDTTGPLKIIWEAVQIPV